MVYYTVVSIPEQFVIRIITLLIRVDDSCANLHEDHRECRYGRLMKDWRRTIYVQAGPFLHRHVWSGGTSYACTNGPAGPFMTA